jgi:tagatose-6-phosphate ketose/aldose isomerase
MFEKDEATLESMGARITTDEIRRQPDLWEDTLKIYEDNLAAINAFLARARELGGSRCTRVIFCGAGTSAYVSDTLVPYLCHAGDSDAFEFAPVATTDVVCAPLDYVHPEDPTVMVSFARSGNSPESMAAYERVGQVAKDLLYLNVTCAPEGKLARESKDDDRALTLLIPRANDKGFAMTGSYSCMLLLSALVFDRAPLEEKRAWVARAAKMGREVVSRESEIEAWVGRDFDRVTYLGSASLSGLAREGQLKILELCAGRIATSFDSSMGYRHGPKSFVNPKTLVFDFVSNDPYTRQYDLDILNEIKGDGIALATVGIQQRTGSDFEGEAFSFDGDELLPEAYLALPFVMFAQTVAINASVKVGNTPDTPSPTGTVNRGVKGVTIHPFSL